MMKRSLLFFLMILLGITLAAGALAQTALSRDELEERLVLQVEALIENGAQPGEHLALGRTYLELGDTFYALPEFIAEHEKNPDGIEAQSAAKEISDILMGMGATLLTQGAPERALLFFDAAEEWLPWYGIDQLRGEAYFMMGDFANSAAMYEAARSRSPRPDHIIIREVEALLQIGDVETARQVLLSALDPEDGRIRLAQAEVILAGGSSEGALAACELLPDEVKTSGRAALLRATAFLSQGETTTAISLLESQPPASFSPSAALETAHFLTQQSGPEKARRFLERRIARPQNNASSLEKLELAELLLDEGRSQRVLEILILDGRPHPARFYRLRSEALELLGQEQSAVRERSRIELLP